MPNISSGTDKKANERNSIVKVQWFSQDIILGTNELMPLSKNQYFNYFKQKIQNAEFEKVTIS